MPLYFTTALRQWLWTLILACLLACQVVMPDHTLAQETQGQDSDANALEPILQAETEAIRQQKEALEQIEKRLPQLAENFQNSLQEFIPELNRLIRLKGFVGHNFKELVLIKQSLDRLDQAYEATLQPLQEARGKIEEIHANLESQKKEMLEQIQLGPPFARSQAQNDRVKVFNSLLVKSANLKDKIQSTITGSENLSQRIQALKGSLQKDLTTAWKTFYFSPGPSIFDLSMDKLTKGLNTWRQGLPVYVNFFLIGKLPWAKFLFSALVFSLFVAIFGIFMLKRANAQFPNLQLKNQIWALLMVSFSVGMWWSVELVSGAFQSVMLMILIQVLLLRGLAGLLWKYRLAAAKTEKKTSSHPKRLWWLFAVSLVLQGLNLPPLLLVLLWPLILLIFVIALIKSLKKIHLRLERTIGNGALVFLIILILVSLFGWVNISLLLTAFLFVLALSLQFGAVAGSLLQARVATFPETRLGYLGQGLIQGAGLPLVWILSIFLAILWLGVNMGDVQFLKEITELNVGWGAISINLFRLILVLIGFYLARSGLVILKSLLDSMTEEHAQLDPGTTSTFKTLMSYVVWSVYIMVALAFLGVNLTSLTVVAGGLSVGIGFGMQSIVNNFISGIILLFGRAIKPGDIVQIGELWAEVKEVNIRSTVVETFDKSALLLPNSMLISEQITNWTLSDNTIRRTVTVGVAYGSDTELVKRLLLYIAETHPDVLKIPRPFARFIDFGASSLDFRLYFFAVIDNAWETESAIRFEIDKIFRDYKIEIAYPQQDLHIKTARGLEGLLTRNRTEHADQVEKEPDQV